MRKKKQTHQELIMERFVSAAAVPGTKLGKQARGGRCTVKNYSYALMAYFYNVRWSKNPKTIKVM